MQQCDKFICSTCNAITAAASSLKLTPPLPQPTVCTNHVKHGMQMKCYGLYSKCPTKATKPEIRDPYGK
ncbi:unnamed protein product, partial [Ceratitis capitata]